MAASYKDFINFCISVCNAEDTGYSMDFRYAQSVSYSEACSADGYAEYARNYHYDWTLYTGVNSGNHIYYDCSSYVSYALKAAGFSLSVFSTGEEEGVLSSLGWKKLDNGNNLQQGDIGWLDGHTEVCYQGGKAGSSAIFMGAHGRVPNGKSDPPYNFYHQVSIGDKFGDATASRTFTHYWRYYDWDDATPIYDDPVDPIADSIIFALSGNAWHESEINPGAWESLKARSWDSMYSNNSGGYGLWQFTNTSSDNMELQDLYNYVSKNSLSMEDGYAQCQYLMSGEGTSHHWNYSSSSSSFADVKATSWDAWWNDGKGYSDDLSQMTFDFFRCWEGINDGTFERRYECAQRCAEYVPEHLEDESITDWISGNMYLTDSQTLNNAVMLYRAIQSINGSSGSYNHTYAGSGGYGNSGDSDSTAEQVAWENFLLSGLGRNKGLDKSNIHIFKHRR